ALLAARGFTSSLRAIEAPRGFAHVLAPERDLSQLTEGLGETYEILENTYKPFACGIVIHPAIDGCIQLRERHHPHPADIRELRLQVHPLVLELTGKKEPVRGLEGKFSVYHSAAVALLDGAAGEAQYSDARVTDPEVVALRRKVRAEATPGLAEDEARLCLTLADGSTRQLHVAHAIGGLGRPMTDADLENKFRGLVVPVVGPDAAERLIGLCWQLDTLPDAAVITQTAIPA
ncbi:MAG TPA: hypothetical protein VF171_03950, partial [Trueperaceae bacterium]